MEQAASWIQVLREGGLGTCTNTHINFRNIITIQYIVHSRLSFCWR